MKLHKILPHINFAFSFSMLVVIVVNSINPMMSFLRGDEFETALTVLVAVGLISSLVSIIHNSRSSKEKE